MKWIAAALILLGTMLFVDHRNGAVPLALGLFMVGYWYFVEREPFSADNSCDWEEQPGELHESSTDFAPDEIRTFLMRVVALLDKGFSEREALHVSQLAEKMPQNDERVLEYDVVFQNKRAPFKLVLFKDDSLSVGIAFFTSRPLSQRLDEEMDRYFIESGQ